MTAEDNMKFMHHCLFEVGLTEGFLVCNNCNKEYIVNKGIPNLVLNDDEIWINKRKYYSINGYKFCLVFI